MRHVNSLLCLVLALMARAFAQDSTSSTLVIPGPMEQSVTITQPITPLSGTRTISTSMTSATDSSATTTSASTSSRTSDTSSAASASEEATSPSAGEPGNVSQTGVSAAQNTGNAMVAIGKQQAMLLGLGVGAALVV